MSHRPVCVPCRCEMQPDKNGVTYIEPYNEYAIWDCDRWKCPKCGHMILTGFGMYAHSYSWHGDHTKIMKIALADPNTVTEGGRNDEGQCDLCHEPADELGEWGKLLICEKCLESKRDQAEALDERNR